MEDFDFRSNKTQWKNNISEDPKKIFSTTKKAIDFVERKAKLKQPFFLTDITLCSSF